MRATIGEPVRQPYPVHIERFNEVLRDRLSCLTRKTYAFAKAVVTWDALFSLALFEHNWLQPHLALLLPLAEPQRVRRYHRRSPASAIALTGHVWSWEESSCLPVRQH